MLIKKIFLKSTSVFLVLIMLFSMFVGTATAVDEKTEPEKTETNEKSVTEEFLEPIIVTEDITKRGESEKHFLCDDGSYIAVSYPSPVHEQVEGQWVDVEYDVAEDGNGISPVDETIKVKLANNTNSAKLVKLEAGGYKISWSVEAENEDGDTTEKVKLSKDSKAALKTNKEITKANKELLKNAAKYSSAEVFELKDNAKKKIESLKKARSANVENDSDVASANAAIEDYNRQQILSVAFAQSNVEYVGAFGEGTTLRYLLTPGSINEEVVLESYNGFKSYSMVMDTDGLTPVKNEFGRVDLTDGDGNVVVSIAPPYMYDSVDALSEAVDVTVSRESKKSWRITYTPDADWLKDQSRVYPVVIDPAVTNTIINGTQENVIDAYVRTGQTSGSNFDDHYLPIGYDGSTQYISYIQLQTLPTLPSGAVLTGAGLVMKFTEETEFYQNIGVYSTSGNLLNGTNLTWSNKPTVGEFLDNQASIPGSLWITLCSKKFGTRINNAYANGVNTLCFAVKFTQKTEGITEFYSSNSPSNSNRPYFTIKYTTSFYDVPNNTYYIKNLNSGLYLTANGRTAGSTVTQAAFSEGSRSQEWRIQLVEDDKYTIFAYGFSNVSLYSPSSGPVYVNDIDNIRNKWRFELRGESYFYISSANQPWTVLDVDNKSTSPGAPIGAYAYHGQSNQLWELIPSYTYEYTRGMKNNDRISIDSLIRQDLDSPFYNSITWTSDDESIASVSDYSREITSRSFGMVAIRGVYGNRHTLIVLYIHVGYPADFNELMNGGDIDYYDIGYTGDGFFYLKKSIADIVSWNGVGSLLDGNQEIPLYDYYDDWYIYSCKTADDDYVYSLYCMREQENDYDKNGDGVADGDGDVPCVKISLVEFEMEALFQCMAERTDYCRNYLRDRISYTVQTNHENGARYNNDLHSYFYRTTSEGAYYIANEYVKFIAQNNNSNAIEAPNAFMELLEPDNIQNSRASRVIDALNLINSEAGYTIYDSVNNKINIGNASDLNIYEQKAILTMFCANADYYSFAAEVQFHSQGFGEVWCLYDGYYNSCLRACMSVDDVLKDSLWEEWANGLFEDYWDLNSGIVSAQREAHQLLVSQFA